MAQRLKTDRILFITVIFMVLFGTLMIYSASSVVAESRMGSSYYFVLRQLVWVVIAIPLMLFFKNLNYRKLQTPEVAFTAMAVVMALLVVVYFIGSQHRWIRLPVGELQPSEFAKPALVVFLAYFIALRSRAINSRYTLAPAILAVGFLTVAVLVADLGTAIVIVSTAAVVFFVAGLEMRYLGFAAIAVVLICVAAVWQRPYRLGLIIRFVDPTLKSVYMYEKHGCILSQLNKATVTTGHELPGRAGEDRGRVQRPHRRWPHGGQTKAVLSARSPHRYDLCRHRRGVGSVRHGRRVDWIRHRVVAGHSRNGVDPR